jgi:hypothetical protein
MSEDFVHSRDCQSWLCRLIWWMAGRSLGKMEAARMVEMRCQMREDNKPCCFCLIVIWAAANPDTEQVLRCCWCGDAKMHFIVEQRVEGHGPRRRTVTYMLKP